MKKLTDMLKKIENQGEYLSLLPIDYQVVRNKFISIDSNGRAIPNKIGILISQEHEQSQRSIERKKLTIQIAKEMGIITKE